MNIEEDGKVKLASSDGKAIKAAVNWINSIAAEPEVGVIYEGTVVKCVDFGAFVNFFGAKDGLVHISQISKDRVEKVKDVLNIGQDIEARVIKIDEQERRIGLSIKAVTEDFSEEDLKAAEEEFTQLMPGKEMVDMGAVFGDSMDELDGLDGLDIGGEKK